MVGRVIDRRAWVLLISCWLGCVPGWLSASERPPNLLLIVADDLGFSDLGCYGGEIETPHLDALAWGGLRLTRFYNAARCCPSRASILTGHYPHRVGLGHMTQDLGQPGYRGMIAADAKTIAQHLAPANYRCFLAGKWHLGTEDPTQHGFEGFYGTLASAKTYWDPEHLLSLPDQGDASTGGDAVKNSERDDFYATDAVTDRALEFLSAAGSTPNQPWFLYLSYHAPHFPLQARREEIAKYASRYHVGWDVIRQERWQRLKSLGIVDHATPLSPRSTWSNYGQTSEGVNPAWDEIDEDRRQDLARRMAIYAAMVDSMDANVGRVIAALRSQGQLDTTLVIFLSDNGACAEWDPWGFDHQSGPTNVLHRGEALERMGGPDTFHSVGSGWANASNTPWRLYKHDNHEGGINSPCIVSWPQRIRRPGRIDHQPAHIIDLLPTFLHVAGLATDQHQPSSARAASPVESLESLPGLSLLPLMDEEAMPERLLYFEHEGNRAVMDHTWKLVAPRGQPWELYDMRVDRTEWEDQASQNPERVRALQRAWEGWAAENQVTPLPTDYQVDYLRREP